jgi:hypothetical protein
MRSSNEKKIGCALYVSNHYWWRDICRVTGLGMENFIKGEYGAIETKVVYFSLLIRKVIVSL